MRSGWGLIVLVFLWGCGEAELPGEIERPAGVRMVLIPAGVFLMGSDAGDENEAPQRKVELGAFYIDKYPVVNRRFQKERAVDYGPAFQGPDHPVVGVTWFQAQAHCRALGKRLPTEAEWEKAARGASGRIYPWGDEWDPGKLIWFSNGGERTHPVTRKRRIHLSPYGAADMAGHVWEWVADWYAAAYYRGAPAKNPKGPQTGRERVLRGGSWYSDDPWELRASVRARNVPEFFDNDYGFRCAMDVK